MLLCPGLQKVMEDNALESQEDALAASEWEA